MAGVSWPFAGLLCLLCWVSGAMAGYAAHMLKPTGGSQKSSKPRRRRRSGYYFSEDERGWGARRWRRRLAWVSAFAVVLTLLSAGVVALANYKARPNAAAGYRTG